MRSIPLRFTITMAVVPVAASAIALLGWQLRMPVLKADMFGTFIAPNAALCFILCGISLLLQLTDHRFVRAVGIVVGAAVALFAGATLAEYVFSVDFGIDRLFFAHRLDDWKLRLPGRFAFNSALAFTFAGISLIGLRRTKSRPYSEFFAASILLIFYLSVIGYLYSASLLYSRVMSPYTAVLFGFLAIALLCGSARHVFVDVVLSTQAGGIVFRRILLAIVVLMPVLGFLRLRLEQRGVITADFGTALFVIVSVSTFTLLTLHTAKVLDRLDRRRRDAEAALIRTEKLAAAGRMAATVAHEINNPLEAVTNLLFLLRSNACETSLRQEYIRLAEQELARVAEITRRTLAFYKEGNRPGKVDLAKLTEDVLELYARKLATAGIEVVRSYAEDAQVNASAGEIRQIITNLLSNAIDAMDAHGGRIEISTSRSDHTITLSLADNGHGIPQEHLARVFEPFFTTKQDVGNGLGLWVTKTLVEKNSGTIELHTSTAAHDRGTVFRVTLPLAAKQPERVAANKAGAAD